MNHSSIIRQTLAYTCLALLVFLVVLMAWPRWLAYLQFLPVQQVRIQLFASGSKAHDLDGLIARSHRAIAAHDTYSFHSTLSLLHYLRGIDPGTSLNERRLSLDQSMLSARASLQGAPLQPDQWLLMSQAGSQVFFPARELAAYFRMAIWSGRVEPTHLINRLQIGFALQAQLDEEGLGLLRDQVLLAWNLRQREFVTAIRNGQLNRQRIAALLALTHPDVLREMEDVLGPATV
ncbi:MAG TPA: hypothetical protein VJN01_09275 [Xanthomonadales bacterium]|nr:hypothetical protein [Xanthomonadales bacterium]